MDQRSFDRLARLLGEERDRRAGLKVALAAVLGGPAAVAALEERAEANRREAGKERDRRDGHGHGHGHGRGNDASGARRRRPKNQCGPNKPACAEGFDCVRRGGALRCECASGITCGAACCGAGQRCRDGACADVPEPGTCLAFGEPCKDVGRRCCAGLTCASGQDGSFPVACYRSKGAACERTAECPFGMACTDGRCIASERPDDGDDGGGGGGTVPAGAACTAASTCAAGTTCQAYVTPVAGAPSGTHCTKDLIRTCQGDPECTCYTCWYVRPGVTPVAVQGVQSRASSNVKACCLPPDAACTKDDDCCLGLSCDGSGVCAGSLEIPLGAPCDANSGPACTEGACTGGTCQLNVGDFCDATADETHCPAGTTCRRYDVQNPSPFTFCLLPIGAACTANAKCVNNRCAYTSNSGSAKICTECITDPACEALKASTPLADCKRWSCEAGVCTQVAATNRPCTQGGGAAGYCQADATCGAATATCDVTAGNVAALTTALANAPYKSAITIGGTFELSSAFELDKFGCNDNANADNSADCNFNTPSNRVPWDVTLVPCPAQTAILDGKSATRIFKLTDYTMTIKGITLRNGKSTGGYGGAIFATQGIYQLGASLTLDGATVSGSTADINGGGIHAELKALTLKNSTFTGNLAKKDGGAVFVISGSGQTVVVNGVTMTSNQANDGSSAAGQCPQGRSCVGAGLGLDMTGGALTCSGTNTINNAPALAAAGDCGFAYTPSFWSGCGCTAVSTVAQP